MGPVTIAELSPELPVLDSSHIRAVVTLIWPYSSSARQFALLLADPDFRRRRKNGQVRARFSGSSARAVANTGVGIGDEVVLSLRGAEFLREGSVSTPGKSIAWELSYSQTLRVQILRNGTEMANLDLLDVAPTPAPRSPIRQMPPHELLDGPQQWSSPAFFKHNRLLEGPIFEAGYDPFTDDAADKHLRKRLRRSYGDWNAWKYSARTPSPDKEDVRMEDFEEFGTARVRPTKLPQTPMSPLVPIALSVLDFPSQERHDVISENEPIPEAPSVLENAVGNHENATAPAIVNQDKDDFVRDADYYDLYAGPNELPPSITQHAVETDTEPTRLNADQRGLSVDSAELRDPSAEDLGAHNAPMILEDTPQITMPPPTLPLLQTDFQSAPLPGMLTPIGKEPSSPNLKPLDSSTLPMPSPFPGDEGTTSYLDHSSSIQLEHQLDGQQPSETGSDIVGKSSFYSSVSASNAPAFDMTHESAFTDLRFTFGLDGSTFSHPQQDQSRVTSGPLEERDHPAEEESGSLYEQRQSAHDNERPMMEFVDFSEAQDVLTTEPKYQTELVARSPDHTEAIVLSSESEGAEIEGEKRYGTGLGEASHDDIDYPITDVDPALGSTDTKDAGAQFFAGLTHEEIDVNDVTEPCSPNGRDGNVDSGKSFQPPDSGTKRPVPTTEVIELDSDSEEESGTQDSFNIEEQTVTYPDLIEIEEQLNETPLYDEAKQQYMDINNEPYMIAPDSHYSMIETISEHHEHEAQAPRPHDAQPDIKMESIEEDASLDWDRERTSQPKGDAEMVTSPSTELLIAVPDEGHKIGETHLISVPASGPARNTRSKTKTSMSPTKEEPPAAQPVTRLSKAKGGLAPLARAALSPSIAGSASKVSPTTDAMPISPYSLRSQSKHLSPTTNTRSRVQGESPRRRSAKHGSFEALSPSDDLPTGESLASEDLLLPKTSPELSQELGASSGKFAVVSYVKDSEGSLHSNEELLTPLQLSSDWHADLHTDTNNSDANKPERDVHRMEITPLKPAPIARETPQAQTSPTQLSLSSPSKSIHSLSPPVPYFSSPRRSLRLRKDVNETQGEEETAQVNSKTATSTDRIAYPVSPTEGDKNETLSAAQVDRDYAPSEGTEHIPNSLPSQKADLPLAPQQSLSSNMPLTPEGTQQVLVNSQPSFHAVQHEQNLPMTPELTQKNSTGLRSFEASGEIEVEHAEPRAKSPAANANPEKITPATGITSRPVSPSVQPKVVSGNELASIAKVEQESEKPSIGLSTPIAYYTPLKDLTFFLNRSSQFHSASNPDILALVTSSTTTTKRASKGPKHWTTTLHITDLSTYPSNTTVQFFRAYADALPVAQIGDVILLRAFHVRSLNRHPTLISGDESAWCVWKYSQPLWGKKKGAFGEVKAREEVKGPEVERGEGEYGEVERLRDWYNGAVKTELEEKKANGIKTRSKDKDKA